MPDSNQNPNVPNFVPGVGRLVTDRYDFQAHIDGSNFRQNATTVDLFPTLVINSVTCTTVQEAVQELLDVVSPPTIQPATASQLGIIQLAGDLYVPGSVATAPKVGGLQGRPVANIPPTTNYVLTWSGTAWIPMPGVTFVPTGDLSGSPTSQTVIGLRGHNLPSPSGTNTLLQWSGTAFSWATVATFSAGGDLSGTNTSQQVNAWTGIGTSPGVTVTAHNDVVQFDVGSVPYITQTYVPGTGSTVANNMTIKAQGVTFGSGGSPDQLGGNLILCGGAIPEGEGGGGTFGGVSLSVGGDPFADTNAAVTFQVTQVQQSSGIEPVVAAFFPATSFTGITNTDIPNSIGGNDFIYIGDTASPPTGPSPTGTLLWSQNGVLNIMQENGVTFAVGSIPNPSSWGTLSPGQGQTITYRLYGASTTSAGVNVMTGANAFTIPNNTSVRADVIFIGKQPTSANNAQYNLSMGFVNNSGSVSSVGTVTSTDSRTIGSWNSPNISNSGTALQITTGYTGTAAANWTVLVQLTISPQQ